MARHISLHAKCVKNWDAADLQPASVVQHLHHVDVLIIHINGTDQVLVHGSIEEYIPVMKKVITRIDKGKYEQPKLF